MNVLPETIRLSRREYAVMLHEANRKAPEEACGLLAGTNDDGVRTIRKIYILENADHSPNSLPPYATCGKTASNRSETGTPTRQRRPVRPRRIFVWRSIKTQPTAFCHSPAKRPCSTPSILRTGT